jgi:quercetin dioxygenase-like cupin family protein
MEPNRTGKDQPYVLERDEGKPIWFLGTLVQVKAGDEQTNGRFAFVEQELPAGFAPPRHIHHDADEPFYVLEGRITFFAAGQAIEAGPGTFVWLPKGVEHAFRVSDAGPARVLTMTIPAGFDRFVEEAGEPAREPALPPPSDLPPDVQKLVEIAARYNIEITGPPPE